MDASLFDRLAKSLGNLGPRRQAIRLLGAAGLAATGAAAGDDADAKKRCTTRMGTCSSNNQCCNGSGKSTCAKIDSTNKSACASMTDTVCCGQDGAPCLFKNNGCDCCGTQICFGHGKKKGKCRPEGT